MKKGIPVSPGVAVAPAYCLEPVLARSAPRKLDEAVVAEEIARLERACAAAAQELDEIIARVTEQVGEAEAAIFRAHRLLLRDPSLINKVKAVVVERGLDVHSALQQALDEYTALFSQMEDEYLRERIADLRDVVGRIQAHLEPGEGSKSIEASEAVIVVASEILPSQAALFDRLHVAGMITETGGVTGHAAILARARGIPAVSGLRGILQEVHAGDLIALDGREGSVYLSPPPGIAAAYRERQRAFAGLRGRLLHSRQLQPVSADGVRFELLANVAGPAEAALAAWLGASGVGLYRTEYLFLAHPTLPDEEAQLAAYRAVIDAAPNRAVVIRTLDVGGDKWLPYLGPQPEPNPALGWRSVRLSLSHPEFLQTQLRAILRAASFGRVGLLFPMVSTVEEVRQLKELVGRVRASLHRQQLPGGEEVPLGIMVEVPAAALCIDALLDEVDFISIGSNDLIQYLMAADRNNPRVASLCEPFSPALFRLLAQVVQACNERNKAVTLCGEMAGTLPCLLPLFGMGLYRLSMSPVYLPAVKELIRRVDYHTARGTLEQVLRLKTASDIRSYLMHALEQVWPEAALLGTQSVALY